ncbi:MAG: tetratricopeptide repeat protein [Lewinella sp.]|uniref:tetratricopeptide repeat protein n=1 Tax=Lewinella sp. TaxID=2004506 RepID=UPI003D6C1657
MRNIKTTKAGAKDLFLHFKLPTMLTLLLALSLKGILSFFSSSSDAPLVQATEINNLYQPTYRTSYYDQEIAFWSTKLEDSPEQLTFVLQLASAYEARFSAFAAINDLKEAEDLLTNGLAAATLQRTTFLRALARNYISQHRFQEALILAEEAMSRSDNQLASTYLLFDVMMELGQYENAERLLQKMYTKGGFAYLIRKAKWEDYKGNLAFAIARLEEAKDALDPLNDKTQAIWLYSNLADFYGHQGAVEKAYEHYRMTLALDPGNWYAYKGLAWMAYAHDNNPSMAREMIHQIMRHNDSPDLHLLLAEVFIHEGNKACAADEKETFRLTTATPSYGHMYRISICEMELEKSRKQNALALALAEVRERPTPETYDLLAYAYFHNGSVTAAQEVAMQHVWQKTFEPVAMMHLREIFPYNEEIQTFTKKELAGAAFEIGPVAFADIKF